MTTTEFPRSMLRKMATLDDDQFIVWAAQIGFTPKPGEERMHQFRERVLHSLDRLNDEINAIEVGG